MASAKDPMHCKPYADKFGVDFVEGQKCWGVKDVDVYMPAATQNDVNMEWAKKIAESGVPYYIEVGNMPTTNDALAFLMEQKHLTVAPSRLLTPAAFPSPSSKWLRTLSVSTGPLRKSTLRWKPS